MSHRIFSEAGYPHITAGPYFIPVHRIRTLPQYLQFKISHDLQSIYLDLVRDYFLGPLSGQASDLDERELVRLGFVLRDEPLRESGQSTNPAQNPLVRNEDRHSQIDNHDRAGAGDSPQTRLDCASNPFSEFPSIASTAVRKSSQQKTTINPRVSSLPRLSSEG